MRIEINGEPTDIGDGTTVRALLDALALGERLVAVERNEHIVPRSEHASAVLREGDRIEIVHFVGGG